MKIYILTFVFLLLTHIHALALPGALVPRDTHTAVDLFKRRGGGGGGGRAGGSSSSSGSSSSGSSGSSGGSRGRSPSAYNTTHDTPTHTPIHPRNTCIRVDTPTPNLLPYTSPYTSSSRYTRSSPYTPFRADKLGSSGSSGTGAASRTSNAGGSTRQGSGAPRSYGGAYAGGAATPYSPGRRSPRGLLPLALLPIGALAFFPGIWLAGAYMYPYSHPYSLRNGSRNATLPVRCLCAQNAVCGCDDDDGKNRTFLDMATKGYPDHLNKSLAHVATVNGTQTLFVNGTLPNGTTAPGGSADATASGADGRGGLRAGAEGWVPWLAALVTVVGIVM